MFFAKIVVDERQRTVVSQTQVADSNRPRHLCGDFMSAHVSQCKNLFNTYGFYLTTKWLTLFKYLGNWWCCTCKWNVAFESCSWITAECHSASNIDWKFRHLLPAPCCKDNSIQIFPRWTTMRTEFPEKSVVFIASTLALTRTNDRKLQQWCFIVK